MPNIGSDSAQDKLLDEVIDFLLGFFEDKKVDREMLPHMDLIDDLGLDSVSFVSLVVELERRFSITVPDEMLLPENIRCARDIARVVEEQRERARRER